MFFAVENILLRSKNVQHDERNRTQSFGEIRNKFWYSRMSKEWPLQLMAIVIGPCSTRRIFGIFGFNRSALRATQPKVPSKFAPCFWRSQFYFWKLWEQLDKNAIFTGNCFSVTPRIRRKLLSSKKFIIVFFLSPLSLRAFYASGRLAPSPLILFHFSVRPYDPRSNLSVCFIVK